MTLEKVVQVEGVEVSLDALWTTPEGHTTYLPLHHLFIYLFI
jgi:hypothetical protein